MRRPLTSLALITLALALWGKPAPCAQIRVSDLDYIHRTFYFIADHPLQVDLSSLRVWQDDRNPSNDAADSALPGRARLDPRIPAGADNPDLKGSFHVMFPGTDWDLVFPYVVDGGAIPVIALRTPLALTAVLGVSYAESTGGEWVLVGNSDLAATDSALGKYEGQFLLKLIKPTIDVPRTTSDGAYDRSDPWYPVLDYELRNIYRLGVQDFDPEKVSITVRHRDTFSDDPESFHGVPYLQLLGLDQEGPTLDSPPDGKVDARFVNSVDGIMFFPDLHPFAPDTTTGDCSPGWGGFLCLDQLSRNPLRACDDWESCVANPYVYGMRLPDPITQSRFYIEVAIDSPPVPAELRPNRPNPFRSATTIEFDSPYAGVIRLSVYDIQGRLVREIAYQDMAAGPHSISWQGIDSKGRAVRSGVYVCRLQGVGFVRSRRMVLLR